MPARIDLKARIKMDSEFARKILELVLECQSTISRQRTEIANFAGTVISHLNRLRREGGYDDNDSDKLLSLASSMEQFSASGQKGVEIFTNCQEEALAVARDIESEADRAQFFLSCIERLVNAGK